MNNAKCEFLRKITIKRKNAHFLTFFLKKHEKHGKITKTHEKHKTMHLKLPIKSNC